MINKNVAGQFKVSNVPTLIGWNASMNIREILDELDGTYGKHNTMMLVTNNVQF